MGEWGWIGRVFDTWAPIEIIAVVLAVGAMASAGAAVLMAWRRAKSNGNGKAPPPPKQEPERRESLPELAGRVEALESGMAALGSRMARAEELSHKRHTWITEQLSGVGAELRALRKAQDGMAQEVIRALINRLPTPPGGNEKTPP